MASAALRFDDVGADEVIQTRRGTPRDLPFAVSRSERILISSYLTGRNLLARMPFVAGGQVCVCGGGRVVFFDRM